MTNKLKFQDIETKKKNKLRHRNNKINKKVYKLLQIHKI